MTPTQCMLAFWMLVTGSINTLSTKITECKENRPDYKLDWAPSSCDVQLNNITGIGNHSTGGVCVAGCKQFDHPFVQAAGMFIGETLCLLSFKISLLFVARASIHSDQEISRPFSPLIFALPALCDCLGTSVMYLGLTMTYASVFQMLRGSVVVFTGILSVLVLHRKLKAFHWLGMALVCAGALVVGSSSLVSPQPSSDTSVPAIPVPSNPFLGNVLIVCAQVIVAVQMVIEEKIFSRYKDIHPLQAVGWEGIFGFFFVSFGLCAMFFIPYGSDMCDGNVCVENALHALSELSVSPYLCAAVVGNMLSVAFFNFFGISLTQSMSATHRMVFDSLRTFVIWVISLYLQWQQFNALQVVGFTILLSGTLVYNEIVPLPACCGGRQDWPEAVLNEPPHKRDEEEALLGTQNS